MSEPTADLIEIERAQIGHQIHDALLPLLIAAAAGVNSAAELLAPEETEAKQKLALTATWIDAAIDQGRRLLHEVHHPEWIGSQWLSAAQDTLSRLFDPPPENLHWDVDQATAEISPRAALAAYRITVEAVRNAIRHAHATQIKVIATTTADRLEIEIRDDGNGFEPADVAADVAGDHFGIRSMRGRARGADGTLSIQSQRGGPTSVRLTLPLTD
jgi:signal transduction histidine kinase